MVNHTVLQWRNNAEHGQKTYAVLILAVIIIEAAAILMFVVGYPLAAVAMVVLSLTTVTGFVSPVPRVVVRGQGVEVFPRPPHLNSHYVFPGLVGAMSVLITAQWIVSSPGADLRLPIVTALAWVATFAGLISAIRQRGNLLLDSETVAVGRHPAMLLRDLQLRVLQAQKGAIPHLELVDRSGKSKKRLIFPEKYYGLDANSVYSTVRHLAETDVETRRSYSPELIREMLLFKPNGEVAVGDSIEVRVVAQPRATTS